LSIIATDCCRSMTTLLMDGELGDMVPVGDMAAMASAIARARPGLQNSNLSLAQAGRFTLDHASEAYLSTMSRLRRGWVPDENMAPSTEADVMLQRL
jgi:hypothetical protein